MILPDQHHSHILGTALPHSNHSQLLGESRSYITLLPTSADWPKLSQSWYPSTSSSVLTGPIQTDRRLSPRVLVWELRAEVSPSLVRGCSKGATQESRGNKFSKKYLRMGTTCFMSLRTHEARREGFLCGGTVPCLSWEFLHGNAAHIRASLTPAP